MNPLDFQFLSDLLKQKSGLVLTGDKGYLVESRLLPIARKRGLNTLEGLVGALRRKDEALIRDVVEAMTTNESFFFRDNTPFDTFKAHVLPQLLTRRADSKRIRIWSAAASTGEEPYSIAMTVAETFGTLTPPVSILATDIDTQVLDTASQGVYADERIERLSDERKRRFFRRGTGENQGLVRVVDELRELVTFRQLNLLDPRYPVRGPFRAIFCRNVMIYFDKPTQYQVLSRMVPLLADDGLFFAGHSESFFHAGDLIESCGRTIYRKAQR